MKHKINYNKLICKEDEIKRINEEIWKDLE